MSTFDLYILATLAGLAFWIYRKRREPGYLSEFLLSLDSGAALWRERGAETEADNMDSISQQIHAAISAVNSSTPLTSDKARTMRSAIVGATDDFMLDRLNIYDINDRRARTRAALYNLMSKLDKLTKIG